MTCKVLKNTPRKTVDQLLLPDPVQQACLDLVHEQQKFELLQSYGMEPRSNLILIGPPGNGKTLLAEAMAHALELPLLIVRYESIIGSYLGKTLQDFPSYLTMRKARNASCFSMNLKPWVKSGVP